MCELLKNLLQLDLHDDDALIIQTDNCDELDVPNFSAADALICRIDTNYGETWCYHPLMFVGEKLMLMPGVYGTIVDVTRAAKYQFGHKLDTSELLGISYNNPEFPRHLFSHLN